MILAFIESISGNPPIENESVPKLIKKINKALGFDENSPFLFQVEDLISDITDLDSKIENNTATIAELEAMIKNGVAELDESSNNTASPANVPILPSPNNTGPNVAKYGQICNTLRVGLAYGALASQGLRQGRYQLSGTVNGKPSWESSTQAIWYIPQFNDWGIGDKYYIGTTYRGLATGTGGYQGDFYPDDAPQNMWYYWTGSFWSSQFNDIVIECEDSLCFEENTLFLENSLPTKMPSDECQDSCEATECCEFWTWNANTQKCGLRCFQPSGNAVNAPTQSTGRKGSNVMLSNKVYVAKSFATASRISCQSQCQSDPQCQSITFYEPNSDKPNTCVLNYGPIKRKESFPGLMGLASSPKFC